MRLRRDILLFGTLAVLALCGGALLLLNRPGAAVRAFVKDREAQAQASQATAITAEGFRATVCAASPCVLVEAGGLAFVVGAGEGAADGLAGMGLMRADLDAVALPDLKLDTMAGLPGLARASLARGRREPLTVFGPSGIVPLIDGANLMLSGDQASRLSVGAEKEDQGLEGLVVFDSGVVSMRAFGGQGRGESRVYRIDFDGKSLVLAGCGARVEQIISASRGTRLVAGVLAAEAPELLARTENHSACITLAAALEAAAEAKFSAVLLSPLHPRGTIPGARAAWREIIKGQSGVPAIAAEPGAVLDLSGATPALRNARR